MPDQLTCLSCGHQLRIADDVDESWLTCPRCLAVIANPRRSAIATSPVAVAELPPAAGPSHCPRCSAPVEPSWRYCPLCNARCWPAPRPRPAPPPDVEVRRDMKGTVICLAVLGVLAVVGVVVFFTSGGGQLVSASKQGPVILLLGVILLVVIGGGTAALVLGSKNPALKAVSGALGGVAIGVTVALVTVLLVVFAICAAIINVLDTCAKCGR